MTDAHVSTKTHTRAFKCVENWSRLAQLLNSQVIGHKLVGGLSLLIVSAQWEWACCRMWVGMREK